MMIHHSIQIYMPPHCPTSIPKIKYTYPNDDTPFNIDLYPTSVSYFHPPPQKYTYLNENTPFNTDIYVQLHCPTSTSNIKYTHHNDDVPFNTDLNCC